MRCLCFLETLFMVCNFFSLFLTLPIHSDKSAFHTLHGTQSVSKFKEAAKNLIGISLGVLRIPRVTTDIVLTLSTPIRFSETSSSFHATPQKPEVAAATFNDALSSFQIKD